MVSGGNIGVASEGYRQLFFNEGMKFDAELAMFLLDL